MALPPAAFPFIEVNIDTKGLRPAAQRAPGVIAVVGVAPNNAPTAVNKPVQVSSSDEAEATFGAGGELTRSLLVALRQSPRASKIYGVRAQDDTKYADALKALEGADDVTFVSLANQADVGNANEKLKALLAHTEKMSSDGNKRIGVAMVDPAIAKDAAPDYVSNVKTKYGSIKSGTSRMILVAARGALGDDGAAADVATAAMSAIAGYEPHVSTVLKPIVGLKIPLESKYSASEIKALSDENIVPIIDPTLIPGESLHFAEGRCFTTDSTLLYVDIVRTLDAIEFELKAGLIGSIGDARITKEGLMAVKVQTESILDRLQRRNWIAGFRVQIPTLDILLIPEASRSATETGLVKKDRETRTVEMLVEITYGPAVHYLLVRLTPHF